MSELYFFLPDGRASNNAFKYPNSGLPNRPIEGQLSLLSVGWCVVDNKLWRLAEIVPKPVRAAALLLGISEENV